MSIWNLLKSKDGWMGDSESDLCLLCRNIFSFAIRRHHCRACYRLVCGSCSNHFLELDGDGQHHRVCDDCYNKLGAAGLAGQGYKSLTGSDVLIRIVVHGAMYLPSATESGLLQISEHNSIRNSFCVLTVGDKIVKSTSIQTSLNPIWNESVDIRVNLSSPIESSLVVEIWDKGRKINGDELICRCRVSLTRLYVKHDINEWYILIDPESRGSSKVHLSLTRAPNTGPKSPPPLLMYDVDIPLGKDLSVLNTDIRTERSYPVVFIFPPDSLLHSKLFYPNVSHHLRRHLPLSEEDRGSLSDQSVELDSSAYLPSNEMYKEGLDNIWMAMLHGGSYVRGTVLLTSSRIIFIQKFTRTKSQLQLKPTNIIVTVSLLNVSICTIKRRYKDNYNALEVSTHDGIGYLFISERTDNELRILEAFRRIKEECFWYKDDVAFEHRMSVINNLHHRKKGINHHGSSSSVVPPIEANETRIPFKDKDQTKLNSTSKCSALLTIDKLFDINVEYDRLFRDDATKLWRRSDINAKYELCRSYPSSLIVPTAISDNHLKICCQQRSGRRLPVLTWIHPTNGASLCRSSQPYIGMSANACLEDELLLNTIRQCTQYYALDSINRNQDIVLSNTEDIFNNDENEASRCKTDGNDLWTEINIEERCTTKRTHEDSFKINDTNSGYVVRDGNGDGDELRDGQDVKNQTGEKSESSENLSSINYTGSVVKNTISDQVNENGVYLEDSMLLHTTTRKVLRIVDLRPFINAKGNALMGKGHEVIARLGGPQCTTLEFAGVANIHVMRDSYVALRTICSTPNNSNFLQAMHDSKWLHHISSIIRASSRIANHLHSGDPVLLHCSDGWDRTSQMCALSQLLLDPFYRTISGFKVLICKDFHTFGYKYRTRSGLFDANERSPVFLQFLDAVWQIWTQFPNEFEFNEELLILLSYMCSARYSDDFLFDNQKECSKAKLLLTKVYSYTSCKSCQLLRRRTDSTDSCNNERLFSGEGISKESAELLSSVSQHDESANGNSPGNPPSNTMPPSTDKSTNGCKECSEYSQYCFDSLWNYVSGYIHNFLNPLYLPTLSSGASPPLSAENKKMEPAGVDIASEFSASRAESKGSLGWQGGVVHLPFGAVNSPTRIWKQFSMKTSALPNQNIELPNVHKQLKDAVLNTGWAPSYSSGLYTEDSESCNNVSEAPSADNQDTPKYPYLKLYSLPTSNSNNIRHKLSLEDIADSSQDNMDMMLDMAATTSNLANARLCRDTQSARSDAKSEIGIGKRDSEIGIGKRESRDDTDVIENAEANESNLEDTYDFIFDCQSVASASDSVSPIETLSRISCLDEDLMEGENINGKVLKSKLSNCLDNNIIKSQSEIFLNVNLDGEYCQQNSGTEIIDSARDTFLLLPRYEIHKMRVWEGAYMSGIPVKALSNQQITMSFPSGLSRSSDESSSNCNRGLLAMLDYQMQYNKILEAKILELEKHIKIVDRKNENLFGSDGKILSAGVLYENYM